MKIKSRMNLQGFGKPKEKLVEAMEETVKKIKGRKGVNVDKYHIDKPVAEKKFFSSFLEVELSSNFNDLVGIFLDFGPINIEILEPEKLIINAGDFEDVLNEVLGKLQKIDNENRVLITRLLELRNEEILKQKQKK